MNFYSSSSSRSHCYSSRTPCYYSSRCLRILWRHLHILDLALILHLVLDLRSTRPPIHHNSRVSCHRDSSNLFHNFYSSISCNSSSSSRSKRTLWDQCSIRGHPRWLVSLGLVMVLPVVEPVVRGPGCPRDYVQVRVCNRIM